MTKSGKSNLVFFAFLLLSCTLVQGDNVYAAKGNGDGLISAASPSSQSIDSEKREERLLGQLRGLKRFTSTPKNVAIAKLLLDFKASPMDQSSSLKFFQDMAALGAGMQDVIGTKTLISNAAIDYGSGFKEEFLGKGFAEGGTEVEKAILVYRRQATLDAIKQVVREFAGKGGKHSVYLAEIGKWTTQADNALTFSGDIDFSFVSLDENLTWQMKKRFDEIIKEKTNLDSVKFDSVCTAHGRATPDVYIGEHGRMYGDEAMRGGDLKPIDLNSGTIGSATPGAPVIDQMVKEHRCQRAQGGEIEPSTYSKEPGLSMEMVRHFNHDIVAPKIFDPIDSILKAAKYVDRSCDAMKSVPGAAIADRRLADFCKEITKCAKNSDFATMSKLLNGYFGNALTSTIVQDGQRPQAKLEANQAVIDSFFASCNQAMWSNAEGGFRSRLKEIDKQLFALESSADSSAESPRARQLRVDMLSLVEMCKLEFAACEANHLTVPAPIQTLYEELKARIDKFGRKKGVKPLTDDEMKQVRFIEECIKSGKKPLISIAIAFTTDMASKAIDKTNNILDYLDDRLLGPLRGDSPDFDTFVRETQAARVDLTNPSKRSAALSKLTSLKSSATNIIRGANVRMNSMIQSTAAGRGAMKTMQAVNLAQEVQAYYEAYNREGYTGLAVEFFRRRVPGGGAVDAYYQENYLRTGVEVVYLIFPPAAIPEGLYGMASQCLEWSGGKLNQWKYDALVDELYEQASFQPGPNGFTLYKLRYECPELIELSRADAHTLPTRCPKVWQLIAPQIKYHPAIQVYEEMLAKKEVSSGHDSIFPYTYSGLNAYGERIQQAYRKQIDRVVEEYFKGVIAELEKRRNFEGGETYKKLQEIEKALGCSKPLLKDSKDRKLIEELISDYESVKKVNALIARLKTQYNADMIAPLRPSCGIPSLKNNAQWAKFYTSEFESALSDARSKVEGRIGRDDPQFEEKARPATRARIGMAWFSPRRPAALSGGEDSAEPSEQTRDDEYFKWHTEFQNELAKLGTKDTSIQIECPLKAYVGIPWEATVRYDRNNPKRMAQWEFLNSSSEKFANSTVAYAKWIPSAEGKLKIRLSIKDDPSVDKSITKTVEIEVLPATQAPKLKVKLSSSSTSLAPDESMPIHVSVVEAAEGDPFNRYFWSENGVQTKATAEPDYEFSAAGKASKVVVSVIARTGKGLLSQPAELKLSVAGSSTPGLRCWIRPDDKIEISDQDSVELVADVARKADSDQLRYQWSVDGSPVSTSPTFTLKGADYIDRKVLVSLYVQDLLAGELKHEGRASKQVSVTADKLVVILSACPETLRLGEKLDVSIRSPGADRGKFTYSWYEWTGSGYSSNSYSDKDSYTLYGRNLGAELGLKAVVRDERGHVGEAETRKIRVVDAEKRLTVTITPSSATIVRGTSMKLRVSIEKFPDSGLLTLNGVELPAGVTESTLSVAADKDDRSSIFSVPAEVIDEMGRKGSATATLYLKDAEIKPDTSTKKPDSATATKSGVKKGGKETAGTTGTPGEGSGVSTSSTDKPEGDGATAAATPTTAAATQTTATASKKPADDNQTSTGTSKKPVSGSSVSEPITSKPGGDTQKTDSSKKPSEDKASSAIQNILVVLSKISSAPYYGQDLELTVQVPADIKVLEDGGMSAPKAGTSATTNKSRPKDYATMFPGLTEKQMDWVERSVAGDPEAEKILHICPVDEEYCPVCAYRAWLTKKPEQPQPEAKVRQLKKVIWHSDPPLTFKDGTTTSARNTVTFDRMNKVKIWTQLEISDENGNIIHAETAPIETSVRAPEFKINFEPAQGGKPGQEVTAKLSEVPPVPDKFINFKWDMPASSNRFEVDKNARSIRFKLKDKDSYMLLVQPLVPYHGDLIGGAIKAEYQGGNYTVKATAEERGPKPMMWDPAKGGLVEVPKGTFAVFEQVYLKAVLEGQPQPPDLRWSWEANEGTSISNPISATPTMTRSELGTATATVSAKDKDGVLLGSQSVSVNFSVSKSQLTAPLKVVVSSDKSTVKSGESISVRATVSGGKAPYKYSWGNRAGSAETIAVTAGKPGQEYFSVQVADAEGKSVTASLSVLVESSPIVLDLQVDHGTLFLQEKSLLSLKVSGGQEPYTYRWSGVSSAGDKAEFTASVIGMHEISVEVTDKLGGKANKSTTIVVKAPSASMTVTPANDKTLKEGEYAIVKVKVNPSLPYDKFVIDWKSSAGSMKEAAPDTALFSSPIAGNVNLTAQIRDPQTKQVLCVAVATVNVAKATPAATTQPTTQSQTSGKPTTKPTEGKPQTTGKAPGESSGADTTGSGWRIPTAGTSAASSSSSTESGGAWKTPSSGGQSSTAQTTPETGNVWKIPTGTAQGGSSSSSSSWKQPVGGTHTDSSTATSAGSWKIPGVGSQGATSTSAGGGAWKTSSATATGSGSQGSYAPTTTTTVTTSKAPSAEDLVYVASFAGRWNSNWGEMTIRVEGTRVFGEYTHDRGRIEASLSPDGKTLTGVWLESPSYTIGADGGQVTMVLSADGNRLSGTWGYGKNIKDGDWTGTRIGPAPTTTKTVTRTTPTTNSTGGASSAGTAGSTIAQGSITKNRTYSVANVGGVQNGPTAAMTFDVEADAKLDSIETYHWNYGRGESPGRVGLKNLNNGALSWWQAVGSPGQGGVQNAYWTVYPQNAILRPGRYQVLDSNPSTWACNAESGNTGFAKVKLSPVSAQSSGQSLATTPGISTLAPSTGGSASAITRAPSAIPVQVNASFQNRDTMPIHMWSHGEAISPYNKVFPGASRSRPGLQVQADGTVSFWVGRNGQTLQTRRWVASPSFPNNGLLRVIWDGRQIQFSN